MRIGYFADGPWSHKSFEKMVIEKNYHVVFIVARFENTDRTLEKYAKLYNINFHIFRDINSEETIKLLSSYNADLFVSMSFNQIIKKNLLKLPRKGFINCHAGALPFYRGRNVLNWVLINGEKRFGVTVHYIDEGIDTGDIIIQKLYDIKEDDNYKTLLERSYEYCSELLLKSLVMIYDNNINTISQKSIDINGSYCRRRKDGDEIIYWNSSSKQIFNFVRGITFPGPGARTFCNKYEVIVVLAKVPKNINVSKCMPGTILEVNNKELLVKTKDSALLITDYSISEKIQYKFKVGDILKSKK